MKMFFVTKFEQHACLIRSLKQVGRFCATHCVARVAHLTCLVIVVELEQKFGDSGSRLLLERHGIRIVIFPLS